MEKSHTLNRKLKEDKNNTSTKYVITSCQTVRKRNIKHGGKFLYEGWFSTI